jgi:hypothetical protein
MKSTLGNVITEAALTYHRSIAGVKDTNVEGFLVLQHHHLRQITTEIDVIVTIINYITFSESPQKL